MHALPVRFSGEQREAKGSFARQSEITERLAREEGTARVVRIRLGNGRALQSRLLVRAIFLLQFCADRVCLHRAVRLVKPNGNSSSISWYGINLREAITWSGGSLVVRGGLARSSADACVCSCRRPRLHRCYCCPCCSCFLLSLPHLKVGDFEKACHTTGKTRDCCG